jgi:L-iditol 2-dehydrogenase
MLTNIRGKSVRLSYTAQRTCGSYVAIHSLVLTAILTPTQENRSLLPPSPTDLQISIRSTGLCGSDLHYYRHYRNGDIIVREPMSLGHESAGVVVDVGSEVSNFKVGDKVALEVGLPCESCDRCKEGRYNICKGMKFRSSAKAFPHAQGTLQDRINHPAAWCHK